MSYFWYCTVEKINAAELVNITHTGAAVLIGTISTISVIIVKKNNDD